MSIFSKLAALDVGEHLEKKGQFTYLSWPWAVKTLRENAPDATWEVIKYDGKPYCQTDLGVFVEVAVTVEGITLSQIHPVLDMRNKPIIAPNAFDINTSIQRCLVKAIALHGLGLYVYAGEDLPETAPEIKEQAYQRAQAIIEAANLSLWDEAYEAYNNITDNELRLEVWGQLKEYSAIRTRLKKISEEKHQQKEEV